jgi:hypothetical protein
MIWVLPALESVRGLGRNGRSLVVASVRPVCPSRFFGFSSGSSGLTAQRTLEGQLRRRRATAPEGRDAQAVEQIRPHFVIEREGNDQN